MCICCLLVEGDSSGGGCGGGQRNGRATQFGCVFFVLDLVSSRLFLIRGLRCNSQIFHKRVQVNETVQIRKNYKLVMEFNVKRLFCLGGEGCENAGCWCCCC